VSSDDEYDAEQLSPRVVHNHYAQSKNGNGETSRVNTILLAALIAIIGFVGVKVWTLSESVARLETNVAVLLARP
jgi:hypothetical protein